MCVANPFRSGYWAGCDDKGAHPQYYYAAAYAKFPLHFLGAVSIMQRSVEPHLNHTSTTPHHILPSRGPPRMCTHLCTNRSSFNVNADC